LINNCDTNQEFQDYINTHQTWVFPVLNVDGFVYDYPSENMWRKNRQPFANRVGTDLNRDFNGTCSGNRFSDWGALTEGSRTSHSPRDETFMGAYGAWGTEVQALTEFFRRHTFVAVISFHSYSELVLWPYGHGELTPDNDYYASLGTKIAAQISRLDTGTYTPEQSSALYPTNCGSDDWMYGWGRQLGGFPCMSFTVELGTDFYQPASELDRIQTEAFKGAWVLMNHADSIVADLEGLVPPPRLARLDTSTTGEFTLSWSPVRPEQNHPDIWELEELQDLTVVTDDIEGGADRWELQGFVVSTDQKHSGANSLYSGAGNNISNYAMTKDPYPVQTGDSLTFWIWHDLERNYDVAVVEVSMEGREWIQLEPRYTGNSNGWVRKACSLDPWAGRSVFIRFRAMSDDGTNNVGVYVDDIFPVPAFAARRVVDSSIVDTAYTIQAQANGQYWYRVRGHNPTWGWSVFGSLEDIIVTGVGLAQAKEQPTVTTVLGVGPNPFSLLVQVQYALSVAGPVVVAVFDASGRKVRSLVDARQSAGIHSLFWDGRN
ncbi:MAG: M14 family zinc carboxypeptidase, partial [candidate division WOR-3 bacterium]